MHLDLFKFHHTACLVSCYLDALCKLNVFGFILFAGTSGVLLRKVNGTAIVQLPSKQQVQVRLSGLRC